MIGITLLRYKISITWDAGWAVQKRLQRMLARKYVALSERDHVGNPLLEEQFRTAIQETAVKLTAEGYKTFQQSIIAMYTIMWSIVSLFNQSNSDKDTYMRLGILFMVLLTESGVQLFRTRQTWKLRRDSVLANVQLASFIEFCMISIGLIKAAETEDSVSLEMEGQISNSLNAGYTLWWYNFQTGWYSQLIINLVTYSLWGAGAYLTDPALGPVTKPGTFWILLGLIASIHGACVALRTSLLTLYTSGSMVLEVAALLNYNTQEELRLIHDIAKADEKKESEGIGDEQIATADASAEESEIAELPTLTVASTRDDLARNTKRPSKASKLGSKSFISRSMRLDSEFTVSMGGRELLGQLREMIDEDNVFVEELNDNADDETSSKTLQTIQTILTSVSSSHIALRISGITFSYLRQPPIFDGLDVYDEHDKPIELGIEGSGIIGVRGVTSASIDVKRTAVLIKLLVERLTPQHGVASVMPTLKAQMVQFEPDMMLANLLQNLLYGVELPDGAIINGAELAPIEGVPTETQLWSLCSAIGVSTEIIGESYEDRGAWLRAIIVPFGGLISRNEQAKISLVRAVLRFPDVLLLSRLGDSMPPSEAAALVKFVTSFIDRSLDELTHAHLTSSRPWTPRTVVWAASDALLRDALRSQEQVITIESASRATLQTYEAVFASVDSAAASAIKTDSEQESDLASVIYAAAADRVSIPSKEEGEATAAEKQVSFAGDGAAEGGGNGGSLKI